MRFTVLLMLCALLAAGSAAAAEKCPLDVTTCLEHYQRMRERPWLGVSFERDRSDRVVVRAIEPKSPCQRAGVRPGDVIERIEGRTPADWFAARTDWKTGDTGGFAVVRKDDLVVLKIRLEPIPEEVFARIVGAHMVEAHLASMPDAKAATEDH
jgi:predicted metalloprotease with PDZ domain